MSNGLNVRVGLLRIWVILSVLFVATIFAVSYPSLSEEFKEAHTDYTHLAEQYGGWTEFPVNCDAARGSAGEDYAQRDGLCWYKMETIRRLYPEYKGLGDKELGDKLYAKAGLPVKQFHPWQRVFEVAAFAIGVPLAVLVLGWSIGWAFAGFRKPR